MGRKDKISLEKYINIRLSNCSESEQLKTMFSKAFQAKSFREFWWYWNPTYGYYLGIYIFRPLKKALPYSISVILTFAACGFLMHDLPIIILVLILKGLLLPFPITIFFIILGMINIISTKMKITFKEIKPKYRIVIHLLAIIISMAIAVLSVKLILSNFRSQLTLI